MGFLSRIRGLKGKKSTLGISSENYKSLVVKNVADLPPPVPLQVSDEMRQISTNFNVIAEVDHKSLPPIAHPIQRICQTPKTPQNAPATPITPSRDTYSVKIIERTCTPKVDSAPTLAAPVSDTAEHRLSKASFTSQRLFDDPSMLSLIALYDRDGCPLSDVFDMTPPTPILTNAVALDDSESETENIKEDLRRKRSSLRLLLLGTEDASLQGHNVSDQSCDVVEWMEKQLRQGIAKKAPTPDLVPSSPSSLPSLPDFSDLNLERLSLEAVGSSFCTPVSRADGVEKSDGGGLSPSPSKSRRASQVFRFLMQKRHGNSLSNRGHNASSSNFTTTPLSIARSIRSVDRRPTKGSTDASFVLVDPVEAPAEMGVRTYPKQQIETANSKSGVYRLFHLPGRPKYRELGFDGLLDELREELNTADIFASASSPANLTPTDRNRVYSPSTAFKGSRSESNLALLSRSAPIVHRKPIAYDLYPSSQPDNKSGPSKGKANKKSSDTGAKPFKAHNFDFGFPTTQGNVELNVAAANDSSYRAGVNRSQAPFLAAELKSVESYSREDRENIPPSHTGKPTKTLKVSRSRTMIAKLRVGKPRANHRL